MIENIELVVPVSKEQTHIATILSYMHAEITTLECKLTEPQQIKQDTAQNLLTGRIRLVGVEASAPDGADGHSTRLMRHLQGAN